MPDTTPVLHLPYILPAQAQKHVTHNEAIRVLDVIVQLSVTARNLAAPPASPAEGDRYIVAAGASGDWVGQAGKIALYENGAWQFFAPLAGWTAWVLSEQVLASYTGSTWVSQADGPFNVGQLGVSATPDGTNRLSVSAPATLLNHAGAGHQLKLNKAASADTASLLFQTGFSGRAEMGTAGGDDFSIKVSADGSAFLTGLSIAAATGQVTLPAALRFGGQASDPVSPPDGTMWLNTTTGEVKVRSNGASIVLAGVSDGDKGDVTVSASGAVWTIDAGAVTNTKLADMQSGTFKARAAAGTGAPEDVTAAGVASMLPVFSGSDKGLAPASGGGTANYLRADGTWSAPPGAALEGARAVHNHTGFLASVGWNHARGAVEVLDPAFWPTGVTTSGVTAARGASGVDPLTGETWVEYALSGAVTTANPSFGYVSVASQHLALAGQAKTGSARLAITQGNQFGSGVRVVVQGSANSSGNLIQGSTMAVSTVTRTPTTDQNVRVLLQLTAAVGTAINCTVRVQGLQFEDGPVRTNGRISELTLPQMRSVLGMGRRLIRSFVASNSASIDITSVLLTAPSGMYEIDIDNAVPVVSNASLWLRTSVNGGTVFAAGASDYTYSSVTADSGAASVANGGNASFLPLGVQAISNSLDAGGANGQVKINGLGQTRKIAFVTELLAIEQGGLVSCASGGGFRNATTPVNGLRLMMSTGAIASGTFSLYEVIR